MIVYGWGYFNRRDHALVRDRCRVCGHVGHLRSYTASQFFTLYFVPVIPLGNERILQECPHCKRALTMPLRKWRKLARTDLPKAVAAHQAAPANPEAAREAIATCVGLQDRATLLRVGPSIRAGFARDAAMLGELARAYSYLCLDKEADAVYLEAVALSPDDAIAADASAHLELQKLARPAPPNRLLQSLPVLIVPAILLFVVLSFLQDAVTGGLDSAYLVNGLEKPYTIVLNGERLTLMPHRPLRTDRIEVGRNEIAPAEGAEFLGGPDVFEVEVSLGARMFSRTLAVVNPDRAAVIAWEKTGYAFPKPPDSARYEIRLRTGQLVQVHEDVDFEFADFPDQISVSSGGGVSYRTRVTDLGTLPVQQLISTIAAQAGTEALAPYAQARLLGGVDDPMMIHLGAGVLPRPVFLGMAEDKVAVRPVHIEWHRAYQTMLEGTPEGSGLEATYQALVEKSPDDSTLVYLLGRILDDPAQSAATFERAARMPQPSAYAANALGYHYVLEGDFPKALGWSDEAGRIDRKNINFHSVRLAALYGSGNYELAEQEAGDPFAVPGMRTTAYAARIYRLTKMGRDAQVPAEISTFVVRVRRESRLTAAEESAIRGYLESAAALARRDPVRFRAAIARQSDPGSQVQGALVGGDLDRAARLADESAGRAIDRLLLYILAARAGRGDMAETQLGRAIEELKAARGEERRWASWLAGSEAPPLELAVHTCPDLENHAVYLAALAEKFPARRDEYLGRAERIRWLDTYATLTLDANPRK